MSSVTALGERLKEKSPVITAWCGIPEPWIAALIAREAYDAVTCDMQHGTYDLAAVASTRARRRSSTRGRSRER